MTQLSSTNTSKRNRTVKRVGLSAFLAASVVGVSLYERSAGSVNASASGSTNLQQSGTTTNPEATPTGQYQDGEYTGDSYNASHWGPVQVKAVVENGELTDVQIVDYPASTRLSVRISRIALPYLISEAIKAQDATVDIISGATMTSEAFMQSLQSALDEAAAGANVSAPANIGGGSQV